MVNWISEHIALILEIIAVVLGIIYVLLIANNKISCWIFGIVGSLVSIYLFIEYAKLYAEAVLYSFYVIAGVYGWVTWKRQQEPNQVFGQSLLVHLYLVIIGITFSLGLYFILKHYFSGAEKPLIDSFTTVFSFIATYITAKKWLANWVYWIVIDAVTTYLYFVRGLELYALLMLVYTFIAAYGYVKWKKLKLVQG